MFVEMRFRKKVRQRHFDVAYGGYLLPTMDGGLAEPSIICIKYRFHHKIMF